MSPDEITLLRETLADVGDAGDELVRVFYANLFEQVPETETLFAGDLADQRSKFLATLRDIVSTMSDLDHLAPQAHQLGSRHRGYGVQARHYGVVGRVLIEALAEVLGDRFTERHAAAWTRGYDLVSELMQQGGATRSDPPRLTDRPH